MKLEVRMRAEETMNTKHMRHVLWLVFIYIKKRKKVHSLRKLQFQNGISISYKVLLRGKLSWVKRQCMLTNVESMKVAEEIIEAFISFSLLEKTNWSQQHSDRSDKGCDIHILPWFISLVALVNVTSHIWNYYQSYYDFLHTWTVQSHYQATV